MPDPVPQFILLGGLAFVFAFLRWRSNSKRPMAIAAGCVALCALGGVLHATSEAARQSWVNGDRILILPTIGFLAFIVGLAGLIHPPRISQASALALAVAGAAYFGSPVLEMRRMRIEAARSMAMHRLARRLYWEEAIRCQDNFDIRFGPLKRADTPCGGHMVVTSRSGVSLPISRVIVNDDRRVYLLYPSATDFEDEWPSARASLRVQEEPMMILTDQGPWERVRITESRIIE